MIQPRVIKGAVVIAISSTFQPQEVWCGVSVDSSKPFLYPRSPGRFRTTGSSSGLQLRLFSCGSMFLIRFSSNHQNRVSSEKRKRKKTQKNGQNYKPCKTPWLLNEERVPFHFVYLVYIVHTFELLRHTLYTSDVRGWIKFHSKSP